MGLTVPLGARAAESAAPSPKHEEAGTTALIVFVAYRGIPVHELHPTWVRRTGCAMLAAALAAPGRPVVTCPDLEPLLQRRRVRSSRDVDAALVEALVDEVSADRLVLASLTIHRDRIQILARGLQTATGELRWADAVEAGLPPEGWDGSEASRNRFRAILEPAVRALRAEWTPPAPSATRSLAVLPLRSEGTDRGLTDLVESCILRAALAHGRWTVPDPALTASAVRDGGYHPLELEDASRRLLTERFGTERLLVPRLIPFPVEGAYAGSYLADEDGDAELSFELGMGVPYHLSLTFIDSISGKVVDAGEVYLAPGNGTGIFGVTRRLPSVQRFEQGADHAIAFLIEEGGQHE